MYHSIKMQGLLLLIFIKKQGKLFHIIYRL